MNLRRIATVLGIAVVHVVAYTLAWGSAFIAGDSGETELSFLHSAILHVLGAPLVYLFHGFSFFIAKEGRPANYHWTQLLPLYEKEFTDFQAQVAALKSPSTAKTRTHAPLAAAEWKLLTPGLETFTVQVGNTVFSDGPATFTSLAPELEGLQGIKFSLAEAKAGKLPPIEFESKTPVRVLIGYFNSPGNEWRKPPTLETDASAADHGGAEPFLVDAATFDSLPTLTVHAFDYPAGRQKLELRGTGPYVILGIVK